ncbi:hypothetical protein FHS15_001167 [Paenibacillus castaneae]|uniref:hypothetical protein n=1 Tax=Paenibacillus castaneae TaxID=474957 RepID=UPI000C9BF39C|nr:hypothetical protein [Paenibacillus castaneae]NIK76060.1 hypothetical protein [Paenibacillus castaneae]
MIMIGAVLAIGAAIIGWASYASKMASRLFNAAAVVALFLLFVILAEAVMKTITHDTVFMTEVHRILLNPVFLASGSYLGPYTLGRIAMLPASRFARE